MISVAEATGLIHQHLYRPAKERIKIEHTEGRVLAEPIKADRDLPPFDRVAMDGVAIQYRSYEEGWRAFKIEGIQPAGQPRLTLKDPNNCIEAMTGAMLPIGCDTVIPYENLEVSREIAKMKVEALEKGQSIHPRAQDAKRLDILLNPGRLITTAEISMFASVGWLEAEVYAFPKVAVISTGDELVGVHDKPLPHQIRRSNSHALQAALTTLRCPSDIFHLTDHYNTMEKELQKIFINHEIIIITGGVSKGKFDLVPEVLKSIGVEQHFHQVSQKPGKPFWFGSSKKQIVFALPGNPVSTFLCFYRYIKPWILQSNGIEKPFESAVLGEDFTFKTDLTYFLQVKIKNESGKLMAYPIQGGGSGDFANLLNVDGFIELAGGKNNFKAGEAFPYIPFR